jgi:hypothetical protein
MANPVTDDGRDPRMFVVPLAFETYAGSEQEAREDAERFAAQIQQITHTGYATPIGAPGDDSATGGASVIELGGIVLRYVPDGTDLDHLVDCLPNSSLPETVGTVADSINPDALEVEEEPLAITVPRPQAVAAAEWAYDAPEGAAVQLALHGAILNVSQGDDGASFNAAGTEVEYRTRQQSQPVVAFPLSAGELKRQVEDAAVSSATQVTLTATP